MGHLGGDLTPSTVLGSDSNFATLTITGEVDGIIGSAIYTGQVSHTMRGHLMVLRIHESEGIPIAGYFGQEAGSLILD
jgi:hypothetical protein